MALSRRTHSRRMLSRRALLKSATAAGALMASGQVWAPTIARLNSGAGCDTCVIYQ
jgi:hypothetical protein